ncbi:MAG: diacylglycerol kinase family protein [Candidatus Sulfotelmatobacter sp.]
MSTRALRCDSVTLGSEMRAAAILGLGCSHKNLKPFQNAIRPAPGESIDWRIGMPSVADQVDVILLFGGDGTVHRHLGQLVQLGLPVLVVPAGSGNDFARALGLRSMADSLAAWRRFCAGRKSVRSIDLGMITPLPLMENSRVEQVTIPERAVTAMTSLAGTRKPDAETHYFCCAAGVGLDGEIARRANRMPRWMRAHGGYALSLLPALLGFVPFGVKIQISPSAEFQHQPKGKNWVSHTDQPAVLAVFANTPFYGGGMRVAPRARMDDALLDICLVADISRFKLFCLFPTVYSGRHLSMPEVKYFQSACLRVETETPLDVYADGEFVCRTPVEVSVQSGALKVLTA